LADYRSLEPTPTSSTTFLSPNACESAGGTGLLERESTGAVGEPLASKAQVLDRIRSFGGSGINV
jgi:hypothetical protein